MQKLATRLLEETISHVKERPDIREFGTPDPHSWETTFPDLTSLDLSASESCLSAKICIATEDIIGPIRNGGIGTTYSLLSRLLAKEGFDVTILYLRGNHVENESIEHWIEYYASFGVKFVPVEESLQNTEENATSYRWLAPMYNMYQHLLNNHYDMVHVSEWRGSGYISLLAKSMGIAFTNTQFAVKCSSPWLWNRLYGNHTIKDPVDVLKIYCERMSVELGDHVIGGSAHLLRWMKTQGYTLPPNTFVQPNVVVTDDLEEISKERLIKAGDIVPVKEIVFFGRLESRKGLHVFCEAIGKLKKAGISLPKISFMGKPGARIETHPKLSVLEYIQEMSADWNTEVLIHSNFQQKEALTYLMGSNRLAVMPSLIENSSLAVYEAVICRIPFLASNSGGTSELISPEYHDQVLFDPHPVPLYKSLLNTIKGGAVVASCSFSNDKNNDTWLKYHRSITKRNAESAANKGLSVEVPQLDYEVFIYFNGDHEALIATLSKLSEYNYPNVRVTILDDVAFDGDIRVAAEPSVLELIRNHNWQIIELEGYDRGLAFNAGAKSSSSEYYLFIRAGDLVHESAFSVFNKIFSNSKLDAVTSFYETRVNENNGDIVTGKSIPIIGDLPTSFYEVNLSDYYICCKASVYKKLGGFTGDYGTGAEISEFVNAAQMNGYRLSTIPLVLLSRLMTEQQTGIAGQPARNIRPFYQYGPQIFRNIFLIAKGQSAKIANLEMKLERIKNERDEQKLLKFKHKERYEKLREQLKVLQKSGTAKTTGRYVSVKNTTQSDPYNKVIEASHESFSNIVEALEGVQSMEGLTGSYSDSVDSEVIYANEKAIVGTVTGGLQNDEDRFVRLYRENCFVLQTPIHKDCREIAPFRDDVLKEGFMFSLDDVCESDRADSSFEIRDHLDNVISSFTYRDSEYSKIEGAVDGFILDSRRVRGWLWNPLDANETVEVSVFLNDVYLFDRDCDVYQEFRTKTKLNSEIANHGFSFVLPPEVCTGESGLLRLQVRKSAVYPTGCTAHIDFKEGTFRRVSKAKNPLAVT